jgi:hypothetical protein
MLRLLRISRSHSALLYALVMMFAPAALAQESAEPPVPPPPPRPSPYSLPFQLRPVVAVTVLRSDTSLGFYENGAGVGGVTVATTLLAGLRIAGTGSSPGTGFMPLLRLALSGDSPPSGVGGVALVNPLLGASYAMSFGGGFRGSAFFGVTLPLGMGGGDAPSPSAVDARTRGLTARASMDNALFAVNDFTLIPGLDFAWVAHGTTVQLEATLLQLTRTRGGAAQPERAKTNATFGIHVGYYFAPLLSVGGELRYQRWLNATPAVDKDTTGTLIDNLTFAVGPRLHIPIARGVVMHPAVCYARGLDKPLAAATPNYHILQADIPVVF